MALSMSVSAGAHNARHNTDLAYRANLRNVDADLSVGNISIRDVPIAETYETVFGDSLRAYNAKQKSKGHPERCIGDYLSKIEKAYSDDSARVKSGNKGRVNVPKPYYEYVLQIGNRDTFGGELDNGKAEEIFRETADSIRSKTEGAIEWFQIAVHFTRRTERRICTWRGFRMRRAASADFRPRCRWAVRSRLRCWSAQCLPGGCCCFCSSVSMSGFVN